MRTKLSTLLVCALLPVVAATGCGGSSKPKTGPTTGLTMKQARERNAQSRQRAYRNCEQFAANPGLPADQKALAQQECQDIQSGDNKALHTVDVQLCELEAPQQPDPATALAACKKL